MRIVVISPHRDDAAFSLGLSIEDWLQAGHRVEILNCFTQSEYAPFSDVDSLHGNDKRSFVSAVRRREDVAWNKLVGGRLKITDLDLLDAPLRLACSVDEVLTIEIRPGDRAVARVAGAVRKLAEKAEPGQIGLVLPLAIGDHIDHRVVHHAAMEALAMAAVPLAFYEDLPYAAQPGADETIEARAKATGFELTPSFTHEVSAAVADLVRRKHRIAEGYDSQIDNDVAWQLASFAERYGGRERLWANPAWRTSALSKGLHDEAAR